ncbi:hypothetical protein F5Y16DRAFT_255015 [Xylariaceae sp. FL0255]|nr:hypothetical protein F5Y16DRAFT_255015 [Xylariaceae sp. FL0255]
MPTPFTPSRNFVFLLEQERSSFISNFISSTLVFDTLSPNSHRPSTSTCLDLRKSNKVSVTVVAACIFDIISLHISHDNPTLEHPRPHNTYSHTTTRPSLSRSFPACLLPSWYVILLSFKKRQLLHTRRACGHLGVLYMLSNVGYAGDTHRYTTTIAQVKPQVRMCQSSSSGAASRTSVDARHMHTCGNCGTEYSTGSCWYCHPQNRPHLGWSSRASTAAAAV